MTLQQEISEDEESPRPRRWPPVHRVCSTDGRSLDRTRLQANDASSTWCRSSIILASRTHEPWQGARLTASKATDYLRTLDRNMTTVIDVSSKLGEYMLKGWVRPRPRPSGDHRLTTCSYRCSPTGHAPNARKCRSCGLQETPPSTFVQTAMVAHRPRLLVCPQHVPPRMLRKHNQKGRRPRVWTPQVTAPDPQPL